MNGAVVAEWSDDDSPTLCSRGHRVAVWKQTPQANSPWQNKARLPQQTPLLQVAISAMGEIGVKEIGSVAASTSRNRGLRLWTETQGTGFPTSPDPPLVAMTTNPNRPLVGTTRTPDLRLDSFATRKSNIQI